MWTVRGAEVMIDIYFFYINSVVFVSCRQNETASFVFGGLCSLHFLDQTQRCETLLKNDRIPPAFGLP